MYRQERAMKRSRERDPRNYPFLPKNAAPKPIPLRTVPPPVEIQRNRTKKSAGIPKITETPPTPIPTKEKRKISSKEKTITTLTPIEEVLVDEVQNINEVERNEEVLRTSVPEISVSEPAEVSDDTTVYQQDESGVRPSVREARSVSVCIDNLIMSVGDDSSSFLSSNNESDGQLSYIMKEKLHRLAFDIQRRTSQMKDHVQRPPSPDNEVTSMGDDESRVVVERRRSLNSFIGLSSPSASALTDLTPEQIEALNQMSKWRKMLNKTFWLRKLLPSSIDKASKRYLIWLTVVSLCFLYNLYGIPLRSSYPYQTAENLPYWLFADYLCDCVYLLDMIFIKPRVRYNKNGLAIKDPKQMRNHYLRSVLFKLDLLSLLPLDFFYFVTGVKPMLRLPRILKVTSYWEAFHLLDSRVSNPLILRIAKTLSYMVYIIHCNSCIYYSFSAYQGFGMYGYVDGDGNWGQNKWAYSNSGNAYIRCFYFTTKLATSIGNNPPPINVLEYIYVTFSWLMGVFVFALLLGQIRDIVATATRHREEFRKKMDMCQQHLKRLKVPQELQDRVRDWFIYTWQQQKTLEEMQLIDKLPLKLQTDLALSVHYETLSKVQMFQDCDKALLRDLVLKLKPVLFLPGDFVCKKGEVGKEMYIVNKGILDVVGGPKGDTVFATLKEGSVFGEISLLAIAGGNKRTADVKSRGFSNLFVLSKDDLNDIIKDYPDAQRVLNNIAKKMLKKTDEREGKVAKEDLSKIATVSAEIQTPKMLETVYKLMDPNSEVAQQLKHALEQDDEGGSEASSVVGDEELLDPLKIQAAIGEAQNGLLTVEKLSRTSGETKKTA